MFKTPEFIHCFFTINKTHIYIFERFADFINELQSQETAAASTSDASEGMMDRIRRASAATLYKKADDTSQLSNIGGDASDVKQFANTVAVSHYALSPSRIC